MLFRLWFPRCRPKRVPAACRVEQLEPRVLLSRSVTLLDPGWRFIRTDVPGAQDVNFDDSSWGIVDLPHTWNNLDGQDGGNNYYRGVGWYRRHFTVPEDEAGRELFMKFDFPPIS